MKKFALIANIGVTTAEYKPRRDPEKDTIEMAPLEIDGRLARSKEVQLNPGQINVQVEASQQGIHDNFESSATSQKGQAREARRDLEVLGEDDLLVAYVHRLSDTYWAGRPPGGDRQIGKF